MLKKVNLQTFGLLLAGFVFASCAAGPDVQPEEKRGPSASEPSLSFEIKSYHEDMLEEMRVSYENADEIIFGLYVGSYSDDQSGQIHSFENFSRFDKASKAWGPEMKVVVQVKADKMKPEIITREEFPGLIELDKVGICWDAYDNIRNVFLVEGQQMLIFLETGYDEANNSAYREMIDAYPETPICRARDVFDLMIRNLTASRINSANEDQMACLWPPGQ